MRAAENNTGPTTAKEHGAAAVPFQGPGTVPTPQFYIPATTSLMERQPRTLKHGDTFALFDHNGDVIGGPGSPEGLFHCDSRYLSHLYLTVQGRRPLLLSSTLREDNTTLTCDLTNPDLFDDTGKLTLVHDLVHIRRSRFLWNAGCFERISVRSFAEGPYRVSLEIAFAADFADLFEVRGARRAARGVLVEPAVERDQAVLAYRGLDDRRLVTTIRFDPEPSALFGDHAVFDLELRPRQSSAIFMEILCGPEQPARPPRRTFFATARGARRTLRNAAGRAASIETSNETFNEALRRAVADLYMLITEKPEGPYPYAGVPWFSTVFGRDALITALQTLWSDPGIARGVLRHLAAHQARTADSATDAEPGKIVHEERQGEMALLGEVPFRRYYGSVDATPLFVMLAGAYLDRTNDTETIARLWPNVEAALSWIDMFGDCDGDGFVEYFRHSPDGLVNQGWKDSQDSVFHADGVVAAGPIALVEVQAYVYGAWRAAAAIARTLGDADRATDLAARADRLRKRFDASFFDDELGTYVLALDGAKRPCRVRASNAGHALFTGIAYPERAGAVAQALMSSSSFSGWGVRTVASSEARYNPMSYHNGSVWPHDNALIASGLAGYDFHDEAGRILEGLFSASVHFDLRRLPELFCGFARQRGRGPTLYPVACSPQAWSAGAFLAMVQAILGLQLDPVEQQVMFHTPHLPGFLDEVVLRNLSLPAGEVDVSLARVGKQIAVRVLRREGNVRVMLLS